MKKISVFLAFMLTFLFSACSSSMFDKLVEAYESSTKELASASSNDDCDRIHDELMEKLYKISQDYPDWEEIIQKEGEDSENVKKVTASRFEPRSTGREPRALSTRPWRSKESHSSFWVIGDSKFSVTWA